MATFIGLKVNKTAKENESKAVKGKAKETESKTEQE